MLDFNTDHKALVWTLFIVFLGLTALVAYYPAYQMEGYEALPNQPKMTPIQRQGLNVYISEGCVACHTQQVRNIEMDAMFGDRPAMPQDYAYSKQRLSFWQQSPSLLGSERTGPDLTEVGERQPSKAWQYLHLYEPRAVVKASVMPSYRWLFKAIDPAFVRESDVVVNGIPNKYKEDSTKTIIATDRAQALVAYLLSLKQPELPEGMNAPEFIPLQKDEEKAAATGTGAGSGLNGKNLFASTCAACHQSTGKGLPGAFPPLAGSPIVNMDKPETMIKIILRGKTNNPDYGPMPAFAGQLTDEEIAAIMTYERSSWGNDAPAVTPEQVKEVREQLKDEGVL